MKNELFYVSEKNHKLIESEKEQVKVLRYITGQNEKCYQHSNQITIAN